MPPMTFATKCRTQLHDAALYEVTFTLSHKEEMLGLLQICKQYPKHVFAHNFAPN